MRALVLAMLLVGASSALAEELLMKFDGIDGGVVDTPGYSGWSRLDSFQWGVVLPSPTGGSVRTSPAVGDPMFLMPLDIGYTPLLDSILKGRVFLKAEIVYLNDDLLPNLEFEFASVNLSALEILIGAGGPIVQGALRAEELLVRQTEYDNGRPVLELETEYDIQGGVAVATATRIVPLNGDYNADGLVDSGDYGSWRDAFGDGPFAGSSDGNGDGYVNAADYTVWRDNQGSFGLSSVPEPTAVALLAAAFTAAAGRRRSISAG